MLVALSLPLAAAAAQAPSVLPARILHLGAHVRVKVPKVAADLLEGTVVASQASPACLAVRLEHTDSAGRQQYAFFAGVTELQVDRRTNEDLLTVGLPPAADSDWDAWTRADLTALTARCRRGS